jgi:hypothetical protein
MDGQTDITKQIGAFRNFANAPKKDITTGGGARQLGMWRGSIHGASVRGISNELNITEHKYHRERERERERERD